MTDAILVLTLFLGGLRGFCLADMHILEYLKHYKNLCMFDVFYGWVFWCCVRLNICWSHFGFKIYGNLIKKQGQYESEVRVSFDVDMCWTLLSILDQFYTNFGAQMEAVVLDFHGVDCLFGCLAVFFQNIRCQRLLLIHYFLIAFSQYELTFVKMVA